MKENRDIVRGAVMKKSFFQNPIDLLMRIKRHHACLLKTVFRSKESLF